MMASQPRIVVNRFFVLAAVATVCSPFASMSTYLYCSRTGMGFSSASDGAAYLLSAAIGAVCFLGIRPVPPAPRIALAAMYAMVLLYFLFFYSLYFVGIVFGDWL
jgi:hypothetical protein